MSVGNTASITALLALVEALEHLQTLRAERERAEQRNLAAFGQQPEQPISIEFISDAVSAAQE